MSSARFTLSPGVTALMADIGMSAGRVLRAAGLPEDLFQHSAVPVTPEQFYRLWTVMEEISGDPALGVTLAGRVSAETFETPIFAALCSPDLRHAVDRIATHKRLLGPQRLTVTEEPDRVEVSMTWPSDPAPPPALVAFEAAFLVALARLGTRTRITPLRFALPHPPAGAAAEAYAGYLGVPVQPGSEIMVAFTARDARRPFLTVNTAMWGVFEPELRRRLADLDRSESTADRVRAALIELLPAGETTAAAVARRLALSSRTLQRRLAEQGTTFQTVLEQTRRALARHYLNRPEVTITEIAFLLGYEEPSSFHRAFRQWSGTTPERVRTAQAPG
ncbi:AraC family transcriptional regulator ligand-binding domain-containing protein [Actinoplanes sp. NPDC024001]|uniref:AraC family transcriptional regulator n=1 Tax=Actinoplanes sp. NPDC024001 TaxID=3154598 RepID=UPI0033FAAF4C